MTLVAGASAGCGEHVPAAPPPPPAPSLSEPAFAIPGDLDLVLRVDVARVRDAFGAEFGALFDQLARRGPEAGADAGTGRLLLQLVLRADTLWLGARPGLSAEHTDNVIVLRGRFAGLVPESIGGEPRWQRPRRLAGGVLRFEREPPALRAAPSVLYVREPDLVVVGSSAEIDALELTLEQGRGTPPLLTPEAGLVAFAARAVPLERRLRERAPTLARLLGGAERLRGSADLRAGRFELLLELGYDTEQRAAAVAPALAEVLAVLARAGLDWLALSRVSAVGASVTVRWGLPEEHARALLACQLGADCRVQRTSPDAVLPSAPE